MTAIGPDEDTFLRESSRVFLLGTRADGSPTGWPMVGPWGGAAAVVKVAASPTVSPPSGVVAVMR